jgi:putative transposase
MTVPRKRLRRRETYLQPRFLTFSCFHRLPLLRPDPIARLFAAALESSRRRHGFRLVAWVVMPEHVHLLLIPRPVRTESKTTVSVSGLLAGLKRPVGTTALAGWRRLRWQGLSQLTDGRGEAHFWQTGGGFDRNVRDGKEFSETIEYIHQNPVTRALVSTPTDYRWSSARAYAGIDDGLVSVDKVRWDERWEWWNEDPPPRPTA